ncbi:MAG: hypothetical protein SGILL_010307 [Bacillariaceae sp.]
MADDIANSIPETQLRFDMNPSGISECLVDKNKAVVPWGMGHVDNPNAISKLLVREVQEKCMPLEVSLVPQNGGISGKTGHAQGGFLRHEPISTSPGGTETNYSVFGITAKHNLRTVTDPFQQVYVPTTAQFKLPRRFAKLVSKDLGWKPTKADIIDLRAGAEALPAVLEYGVDISVGELIKSPSEFVTEKKKSFARVRKGFRPARGQKVGIAVWFPEESKPNQTTVAGAFESKIDISDDLLRAIFGEHGRVNIYTGVIKYVGGNFIEYDINSFTGCSGAIVFLLDCDQPDSVDPHDYGKAIAIHCGAHPTVGDRNVGFLINSHPLLGLDEE